nr:SDR family oxidoreductase [Thermoleophilaceae bacterium]
PLEVWVNNAGVLRTRKAWEHPDDEVRLQVEVNLLGVMWGSRAALEAMRERGGQDMHVINLGSMSAFAPVPGLAVYAATKHAVLGFTTSLQGDLMAAGLPIKMHVVCPDGADTDMTRERAHEPESAIIWSSPRMLSAGEVASTVVGLLDSKRLVVAVPRWRGLAARAAALAGRPALHTSELMRRQGERRRARG